LLTKTAQGAANNTDPMFIAGDLVPHGVAIGLWMLLLPVCAFAWRLADWHALLSVPARQHLVFGAILFCLVLWLLSVRVIDGLWLHFLGMTSVTLLLGARFALLAGTAALVLLALLLGESWRGLSPAWLLTVAIPVAVSRLLVHALRKLRSRNLFIYLLGAGFGGGLLSVLAVATAALPLLWIIGQEGWTRSALENWPLIALMLFPEGFINGMLVTTLTVFHPQIMKTFDDRHYLDGD
jgi:uncharacterized membrane protein